MTKAAYAEVTEEAMASRLTRTPLPIGRAFRTYVASCMLAQLDQFGSVKWEMSVNTWRFVQREKDLTAAN